MNWNNKKYGKIFSKYRQSKILVVGDLILDVFIWGHVNRISPEAPVPIVEVERNSRILGGAANVAHNLRSLGAKAVAVGIVGADRDGKHLIEQMLATGIDVGGVLKDPNRPTSVKTRVIAHQQQVVRIDHETCSKHNTNFKKKLMNMFAKESDSIDAIIIEDYGKGVVTQDIVNVIIDYSRCNNIPVAVDPKKGSSIDYHGIQIATPNYSEACYFAGISDADHDGVEEAGNILLKRWNCDTLLVTLGEKGMCLFEKKQKPYFIPTAAREVYDVSGAGDTVIAAFMLSLVSGASPREAACLANVAAGIVIGKLGTAVVSLEEMKKEFDHDRKK